MLARTGKINAGGDPHYSSEPCLRSRPLGVHLRDNPPLVFGQAHTVGVSIHGSATQQGADLTVGYRDVDIAVVPVTAVDASGQIVPIKADVAGKDGGMSSNSLSVLGQFEVDAQAAGPKVGLGKFFATGLAADKLADGFNAKLSK